MLTVTVALGEPGGAGEGLEGDEEYPLPPHPQMMAAVPMATAAPENNRDRMLN
jgi:hypothetical protein